MLIIDTHVLVWFVSDPDSLSVAAKNAIDHTIAMGGEILISSISVWEIAMLIAKGRLIISLDIETWLSQVNKIGGFRFIPIDNEIGYKSTLLPGEFHNDPADRMIVATARKFAIPLVTADQKIRAYQHVKTIW